FKQHPNSGLKIAYDRGDKTPTAFAFLQGEDALITKFNQVLEALRQDGTLKQISIEWFGYDITQ
ncbi:transporter substrate-binding domain-containing protein, partial [Streptococcus pneumoniae]